MITHVVAVGIQAMLKKEFGIDARIKKTNDLLVDGRKICGILTETSTQSGKLEAVIVGVGF